MYMFKYVYTCLQFVCRRVIGVWVCVCVLLSTYVLVCLFSDLQMPRPGALCSSGPLFPYILGSGM